MEHCWALSSKNMQTIEVLNLNSRYFWNLIVHFSTPGSEVLWKSVSRKNTFWKKNLWAWPYKGFWLNFSWLKVSDGVIISESAELRCWDEGWRFCLAYFLTNWHSLTRDTVHVVTHTLHSPLNYSNCESGKGSFRKKCLILFQWSRI